MPEELECHVKTKWKHQREVTKSIGYVVKTFYSCYL